MNLIKLLNLWPPFGEAPDITIVYRRFPRFDKAQAVGFQRPSPSQTAYYPRKAQPQSAGFRRPA